MTMYYGEDPFCGDYAVELHDIVEVRIDGVTYDGVVTKLHPRSHEIAVRYADHVNTRRDGQPRTRSARVHVLAVDLIARDG